MPKQMIESLKTHNAIFEHNISELEFDEKLNILQLGSMIIFDFITGHHDRYQRM